MSAYEKNLTDKDGNDVYPITKAEAVYMDDNKTTVLDKIKSMISSFQAGVDGIYNAITAQGTTPASKSQSDVQTAIGTLSTNRYNAGVSSVTLNTPSVSGRAVTVTASNGKSTTGYVADKGQYYSSSNNVGEAGTYFHATFPEGYYSSYGAAWAPEIRVERTTMNSSGWYDTSQYNQHYTDGYNSGYSNGQNSVRTGGGKDRGGNWKDGRADMASESIWIPRCVAAVVEMKGTGNGDYPPAIFLSSGYVVSQRSYGDEDCTVFVVANCTSAQTATLRGAYHGDPVYFLTTIGEY